MQPAIIAVAFLVLLSGTEIVIAVTPDDVAPAQVTVSRGDRVRWRAPASALVELDLEDHSGQHIVTTRAGSVAVTFLDTGPHPYVVRVGAGRRFRGHVAVQAGSEAVPGPLCAPGSSRSLCIEP
jgi:plastocyanin